MSIVRITEKYFEDAFNVITEGFGDDIENLEWVRNSLTASITGDYSHSDFEEEEVTSIRFWGEKRKYGIVGTTALLEKVDDLAPWLGFFGVLSEYRCQGIGQKLLDFTMNYARKEGHNIMRLCTTSESISDAANRMYERNRFKLIRRENTGLGFRQLYRERKL